VSSETWKPGFPSEKEGAAAQDPSPGLLELLIVVVPVVAVGDGEVVVGAAVPVVVGVVVVVVGVGGCATVTPCGPPEERDVCTTEMAMAMIIATTATVAAKTTRRRWRHFRSAGSTLRSSMLGSTDLTVRRLSAYEKVQPPGRTSQ
jgi:hypothetical protein